jgi:hypothetical protein
MTVQGFPLEKLSMITVVNDFVILDAKGAKIGYQYFREGDKPHHAVEMPQDQLETFLFKISEVTKGEASAALGTDKAA